MSHELIHSDKHIDFFMLITDRKKKDELLNLLSQAGARIVNTIYAKGSVNASSLYEAFGFIPEQNKVILTCLLSKEKSDVLMDVLIQKFDFDKPNTGIAFTIPVEGLSY